MNGAIEGCGALLDTKYLLGGLASHLPLFPITWTKGRGLLMYAASGNSTNVLLCTRHAPMVFRVSESSEFTHDLQSRCSDVPPMT